MGSGRGDRNQWLRYGIEFPLGSDASMGSGRGDRNQRDPAVLRLRVVTLQWGPVVVTGISAPLLVARGDTSRLQWGPVVVTGIRAKRLSMKLHSGARFNGVRSW